MEAPLGNALVGQNLWHSAAEKAFRGLLYKKLR